MRQNKSQWHFKERIVFDLYYEGENVLGMLFLKTRNVFFFFFSYCQRFRRFYQVQDRTKKNLNLHIIIIHFKNLLILLIFFLTLIKYLLIQIHFYY